MNYHLTCSSAILCSFLASGCSTQTLKQTDEVSSSAIIYTDSVNEVLEKTKERVFTMDTQQLIMARSSKIRGMNVKKLKQKEEALANWMASADKLKKQNNVLQRYFKALQTMIEEPKRSNMSYALVNLSSTLSEINQTESSRHNVYSPNRTLTVSQESDIGSLSETLISQHYASKVKQVLIRDRNIIDRLLMLQGRQLKMLEAAYQRRARMENDDHYTNQVFAPYIDTSPNSHFDEGTWTHNRRTWFENQKAMTVFDEVKEANKEFRKRWKDILQGKRDAGAVATILGETSQFLNTASNLQHSFTNPPTHTSLTVIPTPQ